jgi:hypothetical protein
MKSRRVQGFQRVSDGSQITTKWTNELTGQVPLEMILSNDNISGTPLGGGGGLLLRIDSVGSEDAPDIIEGVAALAVTYAGLR